MTLHTAPDGLDAIGEEIVEIARSRILEYIANGLSSIWVNGCQFAGINNQQINVFRGSRPAGEA
jgi:hypothetical protein